MECCDGVTPEEGGNLFSLVTHGFPGIFHSVTVVRPHVRQRLIKGHCKRKIQTFPVCRLWVLYAALGVHLTPETALPICHMAISVPPWDMKPHSLSISPFYPSVIYTSMHVFTQNVTLKPLSEEKKKFWSTSTLLHFQ